MSRDLRIVRYHPRAAVGDGGMTGAIRRWSAALSSLGAHVTIAFDDGTPPDDPGDVTWTRVRHVGGRGLRLPVGLEATFADADLVVLHSGWTLHNARAAAVARSLGVPYLLEPRGAYDPHIVARHRFRKRAWWHLAEKSVVRGAAAIHAFFDDELAHIEQIGYRGPVVVAPNGVNTPATPQWEGGGGYLLWLGRFDPEHKGLDLLIEAVASLPPDRRPTIRLNGPDWSGGKAVAERLIRARGLERWVLVGPAVYGETKTRMLREASGFLYPSRWDACPNAVLESVAMGVPTLCTPYPLGVALGSRGAALVVPATPAGLVDGLQSLGDPDTVRRMSAVGHEVCATDFRWDAVAAQWLEQVARHVRPRALRAPGRPDRSTIAPSLLP
jgi:glycosyltransferase involved in cell wall biosynthesis